MAFIYMDYVGPLMNNFYMNSAVFQKFRKRWGENGTVYDYGLAFYLANQVVKDEALKRFINAIGMTYEDLEANDYDEVEMAWFWFNKNRQPNDPAETRTVASDISQSLNENLTIGDKAIVRLTYGGPTRFYSMIHQESWSINNGGSISSGGMNTGDIMKMIHGEPWKYIANFREDYAARDTVEFQKINTGTGYAGSNTNGFDDGRKEVWDSELQPQGMGRLNSTPITTTSVMTSRSTMMDTSKAELFALALLDKYNTSFEPTLNEEGEIRVMDSSHSSYVRNRNVPPKEELFNEDGSLIVFPHQGIELERSGACSSYYEEYEFTFVGSTPLDGLITEINSKMENLYIRDRRHMNVMDTLQKRMMNFLRVYESPTMTRAVVYSKWGEYFQGDNLIKAKVDTMKRYEFVNLLSDCLDTDFRAEDASLFERVFAVLIVVVAIVITFYTAGAFAANAAWLAGLAQGLGYAALVLSIGTLVLSQMGLSAASLVKTIGKVAQIVGIAASITGIMAAATNAFNAAAKAAETAGTVANAAEYTVGQFVKDTVNNVIDKATESITGLFDVITDPMGSLMGTGDSVAKDGIAGWLGRLENGMKMTTNFMNSSAATENEPAPTEEQLSKTAFQYPEDMYDLQEQTVYEPDALQKMSIMKDDMFGLEKTEKLLDRIA